MCTIITADRSLPTRDLVRRMRADAVWNGDGWSLLFIDKYGGHTSAKTLELETAIGLVSAIPYDRIFVHARAATQGKPLLHNAHGWDVGGIYYFHNGILQSRYAARYEVDSQLIGFWLNLGVPNAVSKLHREQYANVFLVDVPMRKYTVVRREYGSLYTDGLGNYSTEMVGAIRIEVPDDTTHRHEIQWTLPPAAIDDRFDAEDDDAMLGLTDDPEAFEDKCREIFEQQYSQELRHMSDDEREDAWDEFFEDACQLLIASKKDDGAEIEPMDAIGFDGTPAKRVSEPMRDIHKRVAVP